MTGSDAPLNVLVVVDHAVGRSGPHRNVVGSLNALAARDDVRLRLLCDEIDVTEPYARSGRVDVRTGFRPHSPGALPSNLARVRRAARGMDLIYVPTGLKSFLLAWAAGGARPLAAGPNMTGLPMLMNPANPSPLMTMRMADAWIEMSEIRVRECVHAGTPRGWIHLVPHAIDTEQFSPRHYDRSVWAGVGLDPARKKILYVGHLDVEHKGVPQLLDAFARIRAEVPSADLVLIGRPGGQLPADDAWPADVHLLGPKHGTDLVRLIASADLFLGPSRYETFWFTPLEAMACGVATVASDVGAVPTMIPDDGAQGRRVRIVDPTTHQFLADAGARLAAAAIPLLQDDARRAAMATAGRAHVVRAFSEERLGRQLVEAFGTARDRAAMSGRRRFDHHRDAQP